MKTVFVEVLDKGESGKDGNTRYVNPQMVTYIDLWPDVPDECILVFAGGERMLIKGSAQKIMLDFAEATADN